MRYLTGSLLVSAMMVTGAEAGTVIEESVQRLDKGTVRFAFESRPDVWGDGDNIFTGLNQCGRLDRWGEPGPVRVILQVQNGRVERLKARLGGRLDRDGDDLVDLGVVPVALAVDYLLSLSAHAKSQVAKEAMFPASLGKDSVIWPRLLKIARDVGRPPRVRKEAVFWTGQAAGEKVATELDRLASEEDLDLELRKEAVFAVSQREADEAVPILIKVARDNSNPELRKTALFWLAEIDDPRVLGVFEEILTSR